MQIFESLKHYTHIDVHIFRAIDLLFLRLSLSIVPQSFVRQFAQEKFLNISIDITEHKM